MAEWFVDAIKQRENTLQNVISAILEFQHDYFVSGDEIDLKPMILKDIANKIDMDISTVSRVSSSKYIQFPWGVRHMKSLFSEGIKKKDGNINIEFINLYLDALNSISSQKFLDDFNAEYLEEVKFYNNQLLSDISKKDRGFYKGLGAFIFDENYLLDRSRYVNERLSKLNEVENLQTSLNENEIIFDNVNKFFFKKLKVVCANKPDDRIYIIKDKTEPPEPIINDGILLDGTMLLIVGAKKSKKTFLTQNIGLAIASGKSFTVEYFVKKCFRYVGLNYKNYLRINKKLYRKSKTVPLVGNTYKAKKTFNFKIKTNLDKLISIMMNNDLKIELNRK